MFFDAFTTSKLVLTTSKTLILFFIFRTKISIANVCIQGFGDENEVADQEFDENMNEVGFGDESEVSDEVGFGDEGGTFLQ